MATVHDLAEDVFKILPRDDLIFGKIVVEYVCADGQVTIVETVDSAPSLRAEFLSSQDERVEVAKGEEAGFELVGFFIASVDELLIEVGVGSSQVGFEVLGSFV